MEGEHGPSPHLGQRQRLLRISLSLAVMAAEKRHKIGYPYQSSTWANDPAKTENESIRDYRNGDES